MNRLGFSKDFLILTLNNVSNRKQFVQIDDKSSDTASVHFGVPQGSVLGPHVLFNIYVADLKDAISVKSYQYADDTTLYQHAKVSDINTCKDDIMQSLQNLNEWSKSSNLAFNNDKTKLMIFSTPQLSRVHNLDVYDPTISINVSV